MIRSLVRTAALAALLSSLGAQAGRPLQTEDAGVLAATECEIEAVAERQRTDGLRAQGSSLVFNCGLGARSQVGIGFARGREEGGLTRQVQLGGKTSLWQGAGDDAAALTIAWAVSADRGDGRWRHAGDDLALVATLPAGPGAVHLNLAHARDVPARLRRTRWAVAYEHVGAELGGVLVAPMVEWFGNDRHRAWWNLALRATLVPERLFVDASYGRQGGGARLVTVGAKVTF